MKIRQGKRMGSSKMKIVIGVGQREYQIKNFVSPCIERDKNLFVIRPNDANFQPEWFISYEEAKNRMEELNERK